MQRYISNQRGLSPIIATILLVFVAVAIVTVLLNWGQDYTVSELDKTSSVLRDNKKSSLGEFVKPHRYINEKLTVENLHSSDDVKITGYMIHDDNPNNYPFLNTVMPLSTNFKIKANTDVNSGDLSQIDLICTPSRVFKVSLITELGEYIDFDVTSNDYDSSSCDDAYEAWDWNYTHPAMAGRANSVLQTSDGGYVLAGYHSELVAGTGTGGASLVTNAFLAKLDNKGNLDWNKSFGKIEIYNSDSVFQVKETTDEGYVLIGKTLSYDLGSGGSTWVIKTDSDGDLDWNYVADYGVGNCGIDIELYEDSYFTCGEGSIEGFSSYAIILSKINSSGVLDWNKLIYVDDAESFCKDLLVLEDGIIIVGRKYDPFTGFLLKTDFNGNVLWYNLDYNTSYPIYSVDQTQDNGFILRGNNKIIKTDNLGVVEWTTPTENYYYLEKIISTNDGGYALVSSDGVEDYGDQIFLTKFNSSGVLDWNKSFGDVNGDLGTSIYQTYDGGYVISGMYESSIGGCGSDDHIFVLKTDANGNTRNS